MADELVELGRKSRPTRYWSRFSDPYLPGWHKNASTSSRREALRKLAAREGCIRVDKKLNQLANVTRDKPTASAARADQRWISKNVCHLKKRKR